MESPGLILLEQQQGNGTTAIGGGAEASFDTNMVIILAALLCALICALGLNSIVRCAMRCGRGLSPDSAADRRSAAAARGLKKSALRRIPVAAYGSGAAAVGTDCAICLGEFESGERVRVLPLCSHGFHVRCIDPWLAFHSSCPTCRRSLLDCQGVAAVAVVAGSNTSGADQHQVAIGVDEC